jgi:ABC-type transport system involved in multi-copper enzyme maturation permease subunit
MIKAIVLKELREIMWVAGITALTLVYFMVHETGFDLLWMNKVQWQGQIPFHSDQFINTSPIFTLVATLCAMVLGFQQTAWEGSHGTFPFLLHRPISRRRVFGIKLAVGLSVQLAITFLVVLAYALWAATPGTHASPFQWSMTTWEWLLCASMTVIYLGAFLAGIRDARWVGTRLLPLVAAVPIMAIVCEFPGSILCRVAILTVAVLVYVAAIIHVVQTRDYA